MKKRLPLSKILFYLSFLINIILVFQVFAWLTDRDIGYYFNSDSLYLPSIFQDIFVDKTGLKGWHLNASPNFIPEWPVYFFIRFISGDFRIASVLYAVFSIFIINLLTVGIFVKVLGKNNFSFLTLANLGYTIILLSFFTNNRFIYTSFLFLSGYHVGVFIMSLLSYFLFFSYIKSKRRIYPYLLFITVFTGALSDRLLIMFFVVPMLTTFFFLGSKDLKKEIIVSNVLNVLAAFLGMLYYNFLKGAGYIYIIDLGWKATNFSNVGPALQNFINTVNSLLLLGSSISVMTVLSFLSLLLGLYFTVIYIFTKRKLFANNTSEKILVTVLTSFVVIVAFTPVVNGSFLNNATLRFNIYAFFVALSLLVVFISLIARKQQKLIMTANIVAISFMFLVMLSVGNREIKQSSFVGLSNIFNFYPKNVSIIDSIAKQHNLKYGVGEYWNAKSTTMFSKEDVRIYTVNDNLSPWFHVTNQNWYFRNGRGKYGDPKFNFILLTNLIPGKSYVELFGRKADTIVSGDILISIVPEFGFSDNNTPTLLQNE